MTQIKQDWTVPIPVSDVTLAFPANVIGVLIPEWGDLPQVFQDRMSGYEKLANYACFHSVELKPEALKPSIDATTATRQLSAVVRSFELKHEHKEAGLAYLLSLWLKPAAS